MFSSFSSKSQRRKFFTAIGFVGCIAMICSISAGVYFQTKALAKTVAVPSDVIAEETPEQAAMALLTKESGNIEYQLPGQDHFQKLDKDEEHVPTGTNVKTGKKSLAHVTFPDNSLMSLSQNTQVVVNFEDKQIKIVQILGNTWHRVTKVLEGNSYAVETPNTLATVRGTEFNVAVLANKRSEISVKESIVDVSRLVKNGTEMVAQDTKRVEQDKHIVVEEAKTPSSPVAPLKVVDIPEAEKQTSWFQRNVEITDEIKKAVDVEVTVAPLSPTVSDTEKKSDATNTPETMVTIDEPTPTVTVVDEIKHTVIRKMMRGIHRNKKLKEIDSDQVLQKNEQEVMKNFGETVMTAVSEPEGQVQGVSTAPVDTTTPISPTDTLEMKEVISPTDVPPTDEPTREIEKVKEAQPTEVPPTQEQPSPTSEETSPTPEPEQKQSDAWYQGPIDMIGNLFSNDTPTETPKQE